MFWKLEMHTVRAFAVRDGYSGWCESRLHFPYQSFVQSGHNYHPDQKFRDLQHTFGDVGLMTGDVTKNEKASCIN